MARLIDTHLSEHEYDQVVSLACEWRIKLQDPPVLVLWRHRDVGDLQVVHRVMTSV
jgi:hypothetical protein